MPLNFSLLLDRLGQANKFRKKSKAKFRTSNIPSHNVPKTSREGPPIDALRMSSN